MTTPQNKMETTSDLNRVNFDSEFQKKFDNAVINSNHLASLLYPGQWDGPLNIMGEISNDEKMNAVPPDKLRHWYSLGDDEKYLLHGKWTSARFRELFEEYGPIDAECRIADIGCSSGRVVRWFNDVAEAGTEVWGIDIDAEAIKWATQNIGAHINFMTNTTNPHLPFEDNYFNFLYGNSLFTHIGELSTAWLMEMRRVLKPGGVAIFTFNDCSSIRWLKERYENYADIPFKNPRMILEQLSERQISSYSKILINRSPWQLSVWYNQEYLKSYVKRVFSLDNVLEEFAAYQAAYVLRKQ